MSRKEAFDDFWKRAEERRNMFIDWSSESKDEIARAIYRVGAELCSLQQLLVMQIFKSQVT